MLIKEERSHPIVTILATIGAGLSYEGEYTGTGISHFVEHTIFKGTAKRPPGQVEKEVKSYGGVIGATTGFDSANYSITVPKEYAKEALLLMEDILFHPTFDKNELQKERDVILKEIKMYQDDPVRRIMRDLWQAAYLTHPYKTPIIGYEGLFRKLKRDDLLKYHLSHYTPNNIVLTVVGDIDKDSMLPEVRDVLGKYKRERNPSLATPLESQQNSLRSVRGYAEINLGYLAMGYHTVELTNNDLYALDILGIILGDWDNSRLNKRLVKDDELLYTVSSFNYTPKYPGLFIIYGIGDYEKLEMAKEAIKEEIEKIKDGIKTGELEAAKNIVAADYINSLETTNGLANAMSQSEFLAGDPLFFERYVENVKKVDGETVKAVAKKYLRGNNLTVSYLYPTHARGGDRSRPDTTLPNGRPVPTRTVLANGMRLILKEDHRLPRVSLVCAFLGGVRVETETDNGISNLASSLLLKGTQTRTEDQIKSFLESRGGEISHFSGKNSFGISLDFLSADVLDALDVLEDVIKNPTFPEEELRKKKEKLYAAIKGEDDDVYSAGFLKLQRALFENYSYGLRVIGENDSLKNLTQGNIKKFYQRFCAPDKMVISIVGDFESGVIKNEIEKRFSSFRRKPISIEPIPPMPLEGIKEVKYAMPREQSLVVVGFRGATLESRDRFCLEVLSSVLSGVDGRLYKSIRNELGLSYALGTFSAPGLDTGYIASYIATDKKSLKKAKDILFKELKKIKEGDIDREEIELAKTALIGRQKISLQSYKTLASFMALDELYNLGYDAYQNYPQSISRITKEDIVEAAKRYIDLNNLAVVTIFGKENE